MTVKNRSKGWHFRHSLWILLGFIPLVYWIPFLYIGRRVKNKRYTTIGFVVLALAILFTASFFTGLGETCFLLSMLVVIAQFALALCVRKKYLIQLAQKEDRDALQEQMEQRNAVNPTQNVQEVFQNVIQPAVQPVAPAEKLNVNSCTEEEFCALPGISIVEAKKMTALRESQGDFATVEAFIVAIGLKPHVAARIADRLYAEPTVSRTVNKKAINRVLDF